MGLAQNAKINDHNFQFAVLLLPHALGRADSYPLNIYPLETYPPRNLPPGHVLTWMVTPPMIFTPDNYHHGHLFPNIFPLFFPFSFSSLFLFYEVMQCLLILASNSLSQ